MVLNAKRSRAGLPKNIRKTPDFSEHWLSAMWMDHGVRKFSRESVKIYTLEDIIYDRLMLE